MFAGQENQNERPDEVKLLLHRQRPEVRRRPRQLRAERVDEIGEVRQVPPRALLDGAEPEGEGGEEGEVVNGEDAKHPAEVELLEGVFRLVAPGAEEDAGDEEAAQDEKH